jgi:GT2 family glycosyltransferase
MVDLSIIIVSWNVADLLLRCLASIEASPVESMEIIVIDSASSDDTVTQVQQRFPDVKLIASDENIGFVAGNNEGLRRAQGRYLLLLNPDTEVIGDTLQQMVTYMDTNMDVGALGPHTLNSDGTHQSTRRRFPTRLTAFFESTWLQPLAPNRVLDHYYATDIVDDAIAPVDWVQGSALLLRRAVYEQIGGLDPRFVMYSEELDWCKRAKAAGWAITYLGSARIIHHGGSSSDQVVARRHIHFNTSKVQYFRKYHGGVFAAVLRGFLLLMNAWQLLLEGAKGIVGHKRALRYARVQAYWQVLRSGLKGV